MRDFIHLFNGIKIIYIYIYIYMKVFCNLLEALQKLFYFIVLCLKVIAMQNDNYLSLINFKVKLHRQRLFFKWTRCWIIGQWKLHLFHMALKHPTWHHGYHTQHGILTSHVVPCLQHQKKSTSHIVFIYKRVSDKVLLSN